MKAVTQRGQKVMDFMTEWLPRQEDQCKGHSADHLLRVWEFGMRIGRQENADLEVLEPALLLHDIRKPVKETKSHAISSAEKAEEILPGFGYSPEEIRKISNAIRRHSTKDIKNKPQSLEDKVLYDADKTESVGCNAIQRAIKVGEGKSWDSQKTAEWYLKRILGVAKNAPLYSQAAKESALPKIKESLAWCREHIEEGKFQEILEEYGFNNLDDVKF